MESREREPMQNEGSNEGPIERQPGESHMDYLERLRKAAGLDEAKISREEAESGAVRQKGKRKVG